MPIIPQTITTSEFLPSSYVLVRQIARYTEHSLIHLHFSVSTYTPTAVISAPAYGTTPAALYTCTPWTAGQSSGSILCPVKATAIPPGTVYITFSAFSSPQGAYAFSIATPLSYVSTINVVTTSTAAPTPAFTAYTVTNLATSTVTIVVLTTLTGAVTSTQAGSCPSPTTTSTTSTTSSSSSSSTSTILLTTSHGHHFNRFFLLYRLLSGQRRLI